MLKPVLNRTFGFSASEKAKLLRAIPYLERAVNSDELMSWFMEFKFEDVKSYTMGLSNAQIYEVFMKGNEIRTGDDLEMDIDLTIYSAPFFGSGRNVIGYTYPNTLRTWINRRFFSVFTLDKICMNLAHEYCHKIGFNHAFVWTSTRERSVPYAVGYKIREIVSDIITKEKAQ